MHHATALVLAGLSSATTLAAQVDYCPTASEVILNTNFTQISPCNGQPFNVSGGVFFFRNVTIAQGVTVRGVGSQPMIWIVTGDFIVDGALRVDGGDGASVNTLGSANFPTPGGTGQCGGGTGGLGSPNSTGRSLAGQDGFGPGQVPGGGGAGGPLLCQGSFAWPMGMGGLFAPGGGGGALSTWGDPWFPISYPGGTSLVEILGIGGYGGFRRVLAGGGPGARPFVDPHHDNDFWAGAYDVARRRWIFGEAFPVGGGGGGGGADRALSCNPNDPNFFLDAKGGGGGGGAGVLIIYARGNIRVGPTGKITANGGNGGGGEQAGTSNQGGGGGGGAGGWIVLATEQRLELHTHGETYINGDYSFSVSAEGGICTSGAFMPPVIAAKYPPSPGTSHDARGFGGFGGLGMIQIFAPPGGNGDGTNTLLDDSIDIFQNGTQLLGSQKQRFIGWRGFPDRHGLLWLDDAGNTVGAGNGDGDLRPSPTLQPLL